MVITTAPANTVRPSRSRTPRTVAPRSIQHQIHHFRLLDVQIRLRLQHLAHLHPVLPLVALRPRRPHRRPARGIQQAKLDPHSIRNLAHNAAQRVHFPHQVPLGDAANRGVARHLRDQIQIETEQRRPQPHARCRHRRLASRVPRTHNYNVVTFRKPHNTSILERWQEILWNRQRLLTRAWTDGFRHGGPPAGRRLPLSIWNRTPGKAQALADRGARLAKSPAMPQPARAVVISMLADVPVCRDVWLGRGEALVDTAPGTILVESSTVTVEWIEELDRAAKEHGCELVDAPVTGSKAQAEAGQLLFLAGGSAAAVDKITPILKAMGRDVVHVGPVGSGARLKLINNFLSGSQAAALAEALSLIERSGLDREKALGVLTEGAPGSPLVKLLSGRMTAANTSPISCSGSWPRTFVTPSVKLTIRTSIWIWAGRLCACSSTPSLPGREKRICPPWSSNSASRHRPPNEENAGQTVRALDVPLGNRPHHPRHQPHRPPGGVGI